MKILLLLLIPACMLAQNDGRSRKDSLRNVIATTEGKDKLLAYRLLTNIYFVESARDDLKMDTLLALYREHDDEALRQESFLTQGMIRTNILSAYANRNENDKVIELAPQFLAYIAKQEIWSYYYSIYRTYLTAYIRKGAYNEAIEGARRMYDEAKERDHNDGKGMALYVMSTVYGKMSRYEEEERTISESIDMLKTDKTLLWLTTMAYYRWCNVLIELKRYDEALQQAYEFEKLNYLYEEESKTKQPTTWMNLWRVYVDLYVKKRAYDKAEIYCDKIDSAGAGGLERHKVAQARAYIYHSRKQYEKALEMADKTLEMTGGDPNLIDANMRLKLMILCSMKGADELYGLFEQTTSLRDSIRNTVFNANLDELRTEYEVDKITAENELNRILKIRNRNYFYFALSGCFLLFIALGIWIKHTRTVVRKNRGLFRQIKEQVRLTDELENEREENRKLRLLLKHEEPETKEDDLFFKRLTQLMKEQKIYTDSEIKREEIAKQIGLSDRRLHDCIKNNTGMSYNEYLTSLRLSHSRELLSHVDKHLTIEAIAFDSGFNSRFTFHRLFREKYGLSPQEFRKLNGK